jgi:beta-lactam-binding protein with PASTA domain
MRSFFRLVLRALVLLVVALVSALTAMQLAIHGREVNVPNLVGKTPGEAQKIAGQAGLALEVERQYYSSTVPDGRILSQLPASGTRVRRGWQLRVAESLGPQRVQIPSVLGESARAAEINIRRRGLDIGAVAQVAVPGTSADQVLAQSPPPNASDVAAPKISLLVSDSTSPQAFVMPSFVGQSLVSATASLQDAGLHVGNVSAAPQTPSVTSESPAPMSPASSSPGAVIVSQDPLPGQKVISGSAVNFQVR